jgi:hypothetical protein
MPSRVPDLAISVLGCIVYGAFYLLAAFFWRRGWRWASVLLAAGLTGWCLVYGFNWGFSALWSFPAAFVHAVVNSVIGLATSIAAFVQYPIQLPAWGLVLLVAIVAGITVVVFRDRRAEASIHLDPPTQTQRREPRPSSLIQEWNDLILDQRTVLYAIWQNGGRMDRYGISDYRMRFSEGPFDVIMSGLEQKGLIVHSPGFDESYSLTSKGHDLAQAFYESQQRLRDAR